MSICPNAYTEMKSKDLESPLLSTEKADGYKIPRPKNGSVMFEVR